MSNVLPCGSSARSDPVLGLGRCLAGREPAAGIVVDQLRDGWLLAADGAVRVPSDADGLEVHLQRVEDQEPADQRVALAGDQLDCLRRLYRADDPGQRAEDSAFGAARDRAGG